MTPKRLQGQRLLAPLIALLVFALWELFASRYLDPLSEPLNHSISAAVETLLALVIVAVSTRAILQQERQLRELTRLKDDLTSMIVHDLRTPLTTMIGSLQTVEAGAVGEIPPEVGEMVHMAQEGCQSLLSMVNNLLDIAKMEAGERLIQPMPTAIQPIVSEVIRTMTPLAESSGIRLISSVATDIPAVRMDGELIKRVLINLLGNAVKFTPSGGTIEIRASYLAASGRLALAVQDTGIGISPEDHKRIFDKFGQAKQPTGRGAASTGLGLTFCKMVVEAHHGLIRVESEPGKGSTFTVEIPA